MTSPAPSPQLSAVGPEYRTERTQGPLERVAPALAWGLLTVTVGSLAGTIILGTRNASAVTGSPSGAELIWVLSWIGFGVVGTLLAHRRPRNPIGWILVAIPLSLYVGMLLTEYAVRGLVVAPGSLPFALAAGWVAKWSAVPSLGLVVALLLVFPTGRIEGRWMRRVGFGAAVLVVLLTALIAIEPLPIRGDVDVMNPLAVTAFGDGLVTAVYVVGYALGGLALVTGANVVVRWHRARGVERQQFRWFAYAVISFPVLWIATVIASDTIAAEWSWNPVVIAMFVGMNGIAAAIGIAVTRYRLFEIDRVVSRTVSYAIVTLVLAGVYAVGVVGVGSLVRGMTGGRGGDLVVAGSTLAVAGVFRPLRARVQKMVDQRFNRARYDAQRTVEEFAHRLRDEVDLDVLRAELERIASTTIRPAHTSLWLTSEPNR
jgi:hypothetical protein